MATPVHIPKVGMTMEEGELVRWLVSDGEHVTLGTPLFEMETDKIEIEVEAESEGYLRCLVAPGTKLEPGAIVGCLCAQEDEEIPEEILTAAQMERSDATGPADVAPQPSRASSQSQERRPSSPAARRLARELGIDIHTIEGTGPKGRVTEEDVRRSADAPTDDEIPYSGRRRTIGERMQRSLRDSAQFSLSAEFAADGLLAAMERVTEELGERIPLLTPLVMKAVADALVDHPLLNSTLDGGRIRLHRQVNIGFATDLEEGLMVPVVHDVPALRLRELAYRVRELTAAATESRLTPDDLIDGTFTLSSLARLPIDSFTPVINPPQVAVLGIGRFRDSVRFVEDRPEPAKVITLSLTVDHRVIDGAPAGRFLQRVGEILEEPGALVHRIH